MTRLLYVRTDRLGETLLNLPVVAALRAAVPQSHLSWLINVELEPLLRGACCDAVLAYDRSSPRLWWMRAWRLARRLKAGHFEVAVISNPMKELHMAVWLAGIPRRIGYDRKWAWCLTDRLPDRKWLGDRHEVEYNFDLVRTLILTSVPPLGAQSTLPPYEPEQHEIDHLLEQQGIKPHESFIAIHPWTSNPLKQWPSLKFRELAGAVAQHIPVVFIGGAEVRERVSEVRPPHGAVIDLVGRLTLRQLAALLRRARLLVSNDSGPVHLAAAVGTPTAVLFGTADPATGPRRWGPWGNGHVVICKPSMEAISVAEVLKALEPTLKRDDRTHEDTT